MNLLEGSWDVATIDAWAYSPTYGPGEASYRLPRQQVGFEAHF